MHRTLLIIALCVVPAAAQAQAREPVKLGLIDIYSGGFAFIADSIRTGLKKYGKINNIEGAKEGVWIVMDYGDVLVHIFKDELRRRYDLDGLWGMAPLLELPKAIREARKESDF